MVITEIGTRKQINCGGCGGYFMDERKMIKCLDEQFCPTCGEIVKKEALICFKCGVQLRAGILSGAQVTKDKTVAIMLAVFLTFWTWLYTYKRDAWKFWLNLALTIVTIGFWGFIAWIWSIIDVAVKPSEFYMNYPKQ